MKRGSILSEILSGLMSVFENMLRVSSTVHESCSPRLSSRMNLVSIRLLVPLCSRESHRSFAKTGAGQQTRNHAAPSARLFHCLVWGRVVVARRTPLKTPVF